MNAHIFVIVATILVMITLFVMVGANSLGAVKQFSPPAPPILLIMEIVVILGSIGIAYWLGMLFYRFLA